jgi:cytochrome P450
VITAIVENLVDALGTTSRADLVDALARPLAMRVVCHLLGVPEADRDRFAHWAEAVLAVAGFSDDEVDKLLELDGRDEFSVLLVAVGRPPASGA